MVTKKNKTSNSPPLFFFFAGSGMEKSKNLGSGDKHLGSATLLISFSDSTVSKDVGSIRASSDTVESEGRQMKQCWIQYPGTVKWGNIVTFFIFN